ncbi:MAG: gcvH [Chlamydiales bacterium]|nr:gcvH [Chlamydiales bacterium]
MRKFTPSHEWVTLEGSTATIGISQEAQKEIGTIIYIELPKVGATLTTEDAAVILESTKAAIDIYSPLHGQVIAVNQQLQLEPHLLNESPEERGWLFQMALSSPSELDHLLSEQDYRSLF